MVVMYLTMMSLEIIFGATCWVVSKTVSGISYVLYNKNNEIKKMELSNIELEANKTIFADLLYQSNIQKDQIAKLSDNIVVLSDYIKNIDQYNKNINISTNQMIQ